jgi:hypothetical protein
MHTEVERISCLVFAYCEKQDVVVQEAIPANGSIKEGLRRVLETCGSPSPDPYNLRSHELTTKDSCNYVARKIKPKET